VRRPVVRAGFRRVSLGGYMKRGLWILSLVLMSACSGSITERAARLDRECAAKNVDACLRLARLHWEGRPTGWVDEKAAKRAFESAMAVDPQQALGLSERACSAGDARSCFEIEFMSESSSQVREGVRWDAVAELRAPTETLYDKACEDGYAVACYQLATERARVASRGFGNSKVSQLLDVACRKGHADACYQLGATEYIFSPGDAPRKPDSGKANTLFQKGCDGGSAQACSSLAGAYYRGEGLTADKSKALQLLERACDLGSGDACLEMGEAYETANGVATDKAKATSSFERACDLGAARCALVGYREASQDVRRAITFLEKACSNGSDYRLQITACASCLQIALLLDDPGSALRSDGAFLLFADLEVTSSPFHVVPDAGFVRDSAQAARLLKACGGPNHPDAWKKLAGAYWILRQDPRFRQIGARASAQLSRKACEGEAAQRDACNAVRSVR
jgi:TPR repeat protein